MDCSFFVCLIWYIRNNLSVRFGSGYLRCYTCARLDFRGRWVGTYNKHLRVFIATAINQYKYKASKTKIIRFIIKVGLVTLLNLYIPKLDRWCIRLKSLGLL